MKYNLSFFSFLLLLSIGCTYDQLVPEEKNQPSILDSLNGFCILFDSSHLISTGDIDYYDFSTHMVYLKENDEFLQRDNWWLAYEPFSVYVDGDSIYSGTLWPGYSELVPTGVYIDFPFFCPTYIISLKFCAPFSTPNARDPRSDVRIIRSLKSSGMYHEGLTLEINECHIISPNENSISFTIKNRDTFNYYILDPDRMGLSLFHRFTNGLTLINDRVDIFKPIIPHDSSEYHGGVNMDWLVKLNSGDSVTWSIHYDAFDSVPPGSYEASFEYPGLLRVELADQKRDDGRIWLGSLERQWKMTVP